MIRGALVCGLLCLSQPAFAQDQARVIAAETGQFAAGQGLSLEEDTDAIAALEQQAFREFRWNVMAEAEIALAFQAEMPDAAAAQILVSTDGERFSPLVFGEAAEEGQVVSVLVTQTRDESEAEVAFLGTAWSFELVARSVSGEASETFGPVLLPIPVGDNLGCEVPGCGDDVLGLGALPDVAGEPRSEPGEAPPEPPAPSPTPEVDRELAQELQSELARVGCYTIAVDGLWGPGSRAAMEAFNAAKGTDFAPGAPSARALVGVARETEQVCAE